MELLKPESKYPYFVFDKVVSSDHMELMLREIEYLSPFMQYPEKTASAVNEQGKNLKSNKGIWLDSVYKNYFFSPCINAIAKIYSKETSDTLIQADNAFMHFAHGKLKTGILLSKYDDGDYYMPHKDEALYTIILWLWREPKEFEGGRFYFHFDEMEEIEVVNNRAIIFPSFYTHSVSEVRSNTNASRYGVSAFLNLE